MPFDLATYMIRRKFLKIFGASFHVLDDSGQVVAYSKQKAFKLKEDIRIYTDESMATELLTIQARQIVDFSAAYDIVDSGEGRKVGAARRKGFSSLVRDSWELQAPCGASSASRQAAMNSRKSRWLSGASSFSGCHWTPISKRSSPELASIASMTPSGLRATTRCSEPASRRA